MRKTYTKLNNIYDLLSCVNVQYLLYYLQL